MFGSRSGINITYPQPCWQLCGALALDGLYCTVHCTVL
jgi:hypothetical protein